VEGYLGPKPMLEIGDAPILWHIMKYYSHFGLYDFIICCGYKGYIIKEYFSNYYLHNSDITFDFANGNQTHIHSNAAEPWKVTVVDTGLHTQTGGRLKRIQPYLDNDSFCLTYGDGVGDIDFPSQLAQHRASGSVVTLTAVRPGGRFGVLEIDNGGTVTKFLEKAREMGGFVNGGFMIMEPSIFPYLTDDDCVLECTPFESLSEKGLLSAYKHDGYWQCMDTQRDKVLLEKLWQAGEAPWKLW
jgi:glucose-1-phosphate cytidylyltransferase